MTCMTFLPHSSASVERMCSQINCMKTKTTNFLNAETVKNRLLVRLSPEKIRHAPDRNQTKIKNGLNGTVSKNYKE